MSRQERLSALADMVLERGSITVEDAVEELGVSPATVRRDLSTLAEQQLISRTRGGAEINASAGELPKRYRAVTMPQEKADISAEVLKHIRPGDVVGFNGGTTTTLAAYELGVLVSGDDEFANRGVVVVTNAINIANDLVIRPRIRVVATGGTVRPRSYELIGPLADAVLEQINIDTLFLGIDGMDLTGVYANHEGEAKVNAALVAAASRVIVVADSTKVGERAFARIAPLWAVSMLITDQGADEAVLKMLRLEGIEVIQVGNK